MQSAISKTSLGVSTAEIIYALLTQQGRTVLKITDAMYRINGNNIPLYHLGVAYLGHFVCPVQVKDCEGYYLFWLHLAGYSLFIDDELFPTIEDAIETGKQLIEAEVAYWEMTLTTESWEERGLTTRDELRYLADSLYEELKLGGTYSPTPN